MKIFNLKREWVLWIIILLPVILYLFLLHQLPALIPVHYNAAGKPDTYASPVKFLTNLVPENMVLYLVFLILPRIDPKKKNYFFFTRAYFFIRFAVHFFLSALACISLLSATGWKLNVPRLVTLGVMILFSILGNYMISIKPNWFVGIRTPWTLSNPEVWRKTHIWGGRLMFVTGIIGFVLILILPPSASSVVVFVAVGLLVCFAFLYSYILFKRMSEENTGEV
jgi:uncharacterized membrane protein